MSNDGNDLGRIRGGSHGRARHVRGRGALGRGARGRGACGGRGARGGRGANRGNRPPLSSWKKVENGENIELNDFPFLETEGVNVRMNAAPTTLDFFSLYFTDAVWKLSVAETNRFAEQFFENNVISTYTSKWKPVTVEEMKVFIGLVFLMGIIYNPSVPMYWSQDALYSTPIFSQICHVQDFTC